VRDPRVHAATHHWAPRLVAAGVDFNDFQRTVGRVECWEGWLEAWVETGDMHARLAEEAEQGDRWRTAGEAHLRAALAYHFAKFVWTHDVELHRQTALRAVASLYAAHRYLDPCAERVDVPFEGGSLVGNLRRPAGVDRPPLVLLVTGLDSTKEEYFEWENVLLARGMATFSLDGPGQGESGFTTHIRADYEAPVAAALDALGARRDLDLDRVGAIGLSLGGYYAARAAAVEKRVKVVVGVSGPFNLGECWDALPQLTREAFVHYSGARDEPEGRMKAFQLDMAPVVDRLAQPCLIVAGRQDGVIPWQQSASIAERAPGGRLVVFEDGNHVCNNLPYRYQPLASDWTREELARVG
jgi:pimeloyl-ACP methyl ester carboxylesterase